MCVSLNRSWMSSDNLVPANYGYTMPKSHKRTVDIIVSHYARTGLTDLCPDIHVDLTKELINRHGTQPLIDLLQTLTNPNSWRRQRVVSLRCKCRF
jgi:hypothetical protein